jgi:hypothetical protein
MSGAIMTPVSRRTNFVAPAYSKNRNRLTAGQAKFFPYGFLQFPTNGAARAEKDAKNALQKS